MTLTKREHRTIKSGDHTQLLGIQSERDGVKIAADTSSSELAAMHPLPETGYLRLQQIIGNPKAVPAIPALIPVGKSTWWAGVKSGRYPQPVRTLGARITAWRVEDIPELIQRCSLAGEDQTHADG